jgi:hypothetical protein
MAAPAPQTTWWLFAIGPDVTELLAVVTLRQSALGSICLNLYSSVGETMQMEYFLGLGCSRQGYEIKEQGYLFRFVGRVPTGGYNLFDSNNVESQTHQPVTYILSRSVYW